MKSKEKRNKQRKKIDNQILKAKILERRAFIHKVADMVEAGEATEKNLENATNILTMLDINLRGLFVLTGYTKEIKNTDHYNRIIRYVENKLKI